VKVLLVDDDLDIMDITAYALRREGFVVAMAADGASALAQIERSPPDVALIDVQLPKMSGLEVLRTVRIDSSLPVIMLTALGHDDDVIRGLQLGADDYVIKPFSPRQLAARIRAVLRRAQAQVPEPMAEIEAAGMVLELDSHEVTCGDYKVRMTPLQFRILYALMLNVGHVVPSNRLVEQAWGFEGGDSYMLKTHICHIRKKLKRRSVSPGYIQGIPGVGYVLHR
jgi:DNA-binding response OmpR family regulator